MTLTIAGAAFAATATSLGAGLLVVDLAALDVFRVWQVGTVAGRDLALLGSVAPVLLVGFLLPGGRLIDVQMLVITVLALGLPIVFYKILERIAPPVAEYIK